MIRSDEKEIGAHLAISFLVSPRREDETDNLRFAVCAAEHIIDDMIDLGRAQILEPHGKRQIRSSDEYSVDTDNRQDLLQIRNCVRVLNLHDHFRLVALPQNFRRGFCSVSG